MLGRGGESKAKYHWDKITTGLSDAAVEEYSYMLLKNGEIMSLTLPLPKGARQLKLERASQKGNNPNRVFEWRGSKLKAGLQWMGTEEEMEQMLIDKIMHESKLTSNFRVRFTLDALCRRIGLSAVEIRYALC